MLPETATAVAPDRLTGSLTDPLSTGSPNPANADAGAASTTPVTRAATTDGRRRRRPRLDPFEASDGIGASDDARALRPDRVNQMREVCKLIRDLSRIPGSLRDRRRGGAPNGCQSYQITLGAAGGEGAT